MIDIQLLRTNLDAVAARLAARGHAFPREEFLALETERKDIQTRTQELQAARNAQAKRIGQAKAKGSDVKPLLEQAGKLRRSRLLSGSTGVYPARPDLAPPRDLASPSSK